MVVVHDDIPRTTWKMAVIEDLIMGGDGLVRAATIRTSTGTTNRPITKLYPLELNTADEVSLGVKKGPTVELDDSVDSEGETIRPQRASARKATDQVKEWVRILSAPPPGGCRDGRTVNIVSS